MPYPRINIMISKNKSFFFVSCREHFTLTPYLQPKVIFHTNRGAKNFKLVAIDLNNPVETAWEDIVPEHEKEQQLIKFNKS